jgi:hypothetical protein
MERDPKISKLIREGGLELAPKDFTSQVMNRIASVPERKLYKPLIGKGGRIIIILLGITLVILTAFLAEPGSRFIQTEGLLPHFSWKIPEFTLNLEFFSNINFSGGIAAALIALFILVLGDAGLNKRRLV